MRALRYIAILTIFNLFLLLGGGNLLIKNGTLLTITHGVLENTDLLILNGKIAKIGKNLQPPKGVKVIDATGKYVMPGIIDAHTHIALAGGVNEFSDNVTAEVRCEDIIDPYDPNIFYALAGGVTMVHTMHGSANPIGGQNIVLKLKWGRPADEMIERRAYRTLKFALGENPKDKSFQNYPSSRMGIISIIRDELKKAIEYKRTWEEYRKLPKKERQKRYPPKRNLRYEALLDLLEGRMHARCHAYRADEMVQFMKLAKEFGFKVIAFEHAQESYKIADLLKKFGVSVSMFADSWAYKIEAYNATPFTPAMFVRKGVLVSINSDSSERIRRLFNEAAKSMRYGGLSEEEALKLITLNPAIQLGVDRYVGSLDVGKDGDVAIFDRHPLSAYTKCVMTIIEGEIYFDREAYLKERGEKK